MFVYRDEAVGEDVVDEGAASLAGVTELPRGALIRDHVVGTLFAWIHKSGKEF
jgi:hypothetical protein